MSIDVAASRDAGFKVEYMPPPPPDYRDILLRIYHTLRGTQVAMENHGMIPDQLRESVYRGCLDGLVEHLNETLQPLENTVQVILNAVDIQRGVLHTAGVL